MWTKGRRVVVYRAARTGGANAGFRGNSVAMIKVLEQAISKVRLLSEEKQRLAADLLEELAAADEPYELSAEELAAVQQGLDQANRREFVTDEEADELLNRRWD